MNASEQYVASLTEQNDAATQVTSRTANSQSTTTAASAAFGIRNLLF